MKSIPFGKPIIGDLEKQAVMEVLNGPILVHGMRSKDFELQFAQYVSAPHAVAVSSCTAAMHLAYFDLGLKNGDEVIVPAQSHVATVHAVEFCNAKPVFVDAEIQTGNIDIEQITSAITEKTKAISLVHFLGMPVNMEKILEIAEKHGLFVLEDCALSIGAKFKGKHVGLHGDAGCFSFYPIKHITTAEGGMLITKHAALSERIVRKRAFGVDRHMGERDTPGVYDVTMLGYNYRLNEIQAAMGIEQLKKIEDFLQERKNNYETLYASLKEIDEVALFKTGDSDYQSSYYCLSIILDQSLVSKRFEIVSYLKKKGIGTSIYYPKPIPHMQYYKEKYDYNTNDFPVASRISYGSIALPVGPHLDQEDMEYIAENIKNSIKIGNSK